MSDLLQHASNSSGAEWETVPLGDVATFINGDRGQNYPSQSDYVARGIPFISAIGLVDGRVDTAKCTLITDGAFNRLRNGKTKDGDLLFCLRGSLGKIAKVQGLERAAIASSLVIIRANERAEQQYLYYVLVGPIGQRLAGELNNGSVQPNISATSLQQSFIPLPPISEQRAIASVLGALDDKIELNRRLNETLEALAQSLFKSWFVDATQSALPKGWREGKLRDCCERVENGGTPKRDEPRYWTPGTVPWLTSGEVRQAVVTKAENFISEEGLANSSAKLWPAATTVVALYGATAGQVCFLGDGMCSNQACCGLIPKRQMRYFIYLHMASSVAALEQQTRGSAQQNLSQQIVADFQTTIPDDAVLEKFDKAVHPLFARWIANLHESRTLAALRDALLPKLLSGELRVPAAEAALPPQQKNSKK